MCNVSQTTEQVTEAFVAFKLMRAENGVLKSMYEPSGRSYCALLQNAPAGKRDGIDMTYEVGRAVRTRSKVGFCIYPTLEAAMRRNRRADNHWRIVRVSVPKGARLRRGRDERLRGLPVDDTIFAVNRLKVEGMVF